MSETAKQWVVDIGEAEFPEQVLRVSHDRPVLVDFWAEWCAPCRMLTPLLESLAVEFSGAFQLVRINIETAPQLSQEFGIQSIPNCLLFRDGTLVDQFVGALPEEEIRNFLRPHCPTQADQLVAEADQELAGGDFASAGRLYSRAMEIDPAHKEAKIGLARIACREGDLELADKYLAGQDSAEAAQLKARLEFSRQCAEAGGHRQAYARAKEKPDSLGALFDKACCLAAQEDYPEALETLLEIVTRDRRFRDDAARKAMLQIFDIVGVRSELADHYRTRLSRAIF